MAKCCALKMKNFCGKCIIVFRDTERTEIKMTHSEYFFLVS